MACIKCKIVDNAPSFNCDACGVLTHRNCASLTSSELKVMDLRSSRVLKFYCPDCCEGMKMFPKILATIGKLQEEIEGLKKQFERTEKSPPDEEIINEIHNRQRKANNIIIHNLPEDNSGTQSELDNIKSIVKETVNEDLPIKKITRFGKKNKNGARSIKITFTSPDDALNVIKNRKKLKRSRKVYIEPDLTSGQIKQLKKLQDELRRRKNDGEDDLFIKYVKGIPEISKK